MPCISLLLEKQTTDSIVNSYQRCVSSWLHSCIRIQAVEIESNRAVKFIEVYPNWPCCCMTAFVWDEFKWNWIDANYPVVKSSSGLDWPTQYILEDVGSCNSTSNFCKILHWNCFKIVLIITNLGYLIDCITYSTCHGWCNGFKWKHESK